MKAIHKDIPENKVRKVSNFLFGNRIEIKGDRKQQNIHLTLNCVHISCPIVFNALS